jgi:hypothetical protein
MSSRSFKAMACALIPLFMPVTLPAAPADGNPGSLTTPKGICPLKHTDVKAKISGPLAPQRRER